MAQGVERTEEEVDELFQGVYECLRIGMSVKQGLDLYGIDYKTLTRYREKFPDIARKIKQAKADYMRTLHASVEQQALRDGNLALKALTKRDKKRWGDSYDVTSGGQPIQVIDFSKKAKDAASPAEEAEAESSDN